MEPGTEMDLGDENWAKSPSKEGLNFEAPKVKTLSRTINVNGTTKLWKRV